MRAIRINPSGEGHGIGIQINWRKFNCPRRNGTSAHATIAICKCGRLVVGRELREAGGWRRAGNVIVCIAVLDIRSIKPVIPPRVVIGYGGAAGGISGFIKFIEGNRLIGQHCGCISTGWDHGQRRHAARDRAAVVGYHNRVVTRIAGDQTADVQIGGRRTGNTAAIVEIYPVRPPVIRERHRANNRNTEIGRLAGI